MFQRILKRHRSVNHRKPLRKHISLECLESRFAPAGDVVSTLLAPNFLFLEGDAQDNQIQIKGGKEVGELTVQGIQGTTVDGASKQTFSGIDRISLLLRDGDDSARISNLTLANVDATARLSLTGITVWGGDGNDQVTISNVSIFADGQFDAQAFITVRGEGLGGLSGDDTIKVTNATVEATGAGRTWAQIDVFGDILSGIGGDDVVTIRNANVRAYGGLVSNRASIGLQELNGGGDDVYSVLNSNVVSSGAGASSHITLEMGDGNDSAMVKNSTFGRLQARLGAGNDELELRNNDIGLLAFLDGGDDDDTLILKNNSGNIISFNFES